MLTYKLFHTLQVAPVRGQNNSHVYVHYMYVLGYFSLKKNIVAGWIVTLNEITDF